MYNSAHPLDTVTIIGEPLPKLSVKIYKINMRKYNENNSRLFLTSFFYTSKTHFQQILPILPSDYNQNLHNSHHHHCYYLLRLPLFLMDTLSLLTDILLLLLTVDSVNISKQKSDHVCLLLNTLEGLLSCSE